MRDIGVIRSEIGLQCGLPQRRGGGLLGDVLGTEPPRQAVLPSLAEDPDGHTTLPPAEVLTLVQKQDQWARPIRLGEALCPDSVQEQFHQQGTDPDIQNLIEAQNRDTRVGQIQADWFLSAPDKSSQQIQRLQRSGQAGIGPLLLPCEIGQSPQRGMSGRLEVL